ncbi:Ig-like domain repeat protein [Nocardioides jiangxiensis]|uniref:Substrate-binding domain-containing protein n=1 Tax=Nocardioides jiangxiensis TaxID=3064524 RepID=A0ABT9B666_9ACTN|nr:Ig-like domain repeat protein [Nocardioides sp. WY-20]MDO7868801.1 substrate-binding domain-containing protein [Nocardioides sp. WY-20]
MSIRTTFAGIATVAASATVLSIAAPAMADYTAAPNDSVQGQAASADVVGFGSDTTEISVFKVADAWNTQATPPAFRIATYQAGAQPAAPAPANTVTLPDGTVINRPNGSGQGKAVLFGASNQAEADFARSSSQLSTGTGSEQAAGLLQIPFAVDTLAMGVSSAATNAPASLTIDQIYKIYSGQVTDWSQVGGKAGTIHASALQGGSGTGKFFKEQLTTYAQARGTTFSFGPSIDTTWQEHSDTNVKNDPNAIAPFSVGRAGLLGGTIHIESGWSKKRAVYNVVRGSQSTDAGIKWGADNNVLESLFGTDGYFCDPANAAAIAAGGLQQMLKPADGGACGQAMTTAPAASQLVSDKVATTTSVADTGDTAGTLGVTATVVGDGVNAPAGTVDFFVDGSSTAAVSNVTVTDGKAVAAIDGLAAGAHQVVAKFTKSYGTAFVNSQSGSTAATVRTASSVALAVSPSTGKYGTARTLTATVTGATDGTVAFKVGSAAAVNVAVTNGVATYTVSSSKSAGTYAVSATYLRTATVASSAATGSLVIAKASPVISETFPSATLAGAAGKGYVKVAIANSTVKPTGTVRIYKGTTLLRSATLSSGQALITLPKFTKGSTVTLTIKYLGSANVLAGSKSFTITQR